MFLIVFRNRKRADMDAAAYAADAERMEYLAAAQPGYLSFRSYAAEDGEVVAISEWADEAAARAWAGHAEHAQVQARGCASYYESYTVYSCADPRVRHFDRSES